MTMRDEREGACLLESTTIKFFLPRPSMCPVPARSSPVIVSCEREGGGGERARNLMRGKLPRRECGLTSSPIVAIRVLSLYCDDDIAGQWYEGKREWGGSPDRPVVPPLVSLLPLHSPRSTTSP